MCLQELSAGFYLKFLTWSSTPDRDRALLTALTNVTACVDEPQFTSEDKISPDRLALLLLLHSKNPSKQSNKLTGLLHCDIYVEEEFNAICEQSSPPVDNKHNNATEQCSHQGQPHVIVFICRSPTCIKTKSNVRKVMGNRLYITNSIKHNPLLKQLGLSGSALFPKYLKSLIQSNGLKH